MAVAVSQEMQIMRRRSGLARAVQDLQSPDLAKVKLDKPQVAAQSPDLAKVKFDKPQVAAQTPDPLLNIRSQIKGTL